jgi:hypothetical protein
LHESIIMPDTSILHSDNRSIDDNIIIDWQGKRIIGIITLRINQHSDESISSLHNFTLGDNIILISITIIRYDDTFLTFAIPLGEQFTLHQVYFQRLRPNGETRGQEQSFQQVIDNIRNQHGCVLLCHDTLQAWYIINKILLI